MHGTLYQLYSRTLRKYIKFSSRLEKGIKSGTFFKKSEYDQNIIVHRVERIKRKLEHLKLQLKLAAAGLATTLIMTTTDIQAQNPGLGPFVQQGRLDNPLRPPLQFLRSSSDMFDIDGDGDLDLFVGENDGSVHFVKNYKDELSLTNNAFAEPSVNPYSYFQAFGSYGRSTIAFADIDGDGDTDAIVGFSAGSVPHIFFEYDAGAFLAGARYGSPFGFALNSDSKPNFHFGHFDGDADLDVFVGDETGDIHFLEWNGSNWIKDNAATNLDDISDLISGGIGHRAPALFDIDGDTFLDAFIGLEDGTIKLFKGTATPLQFNATEEIAGNPFNSVNASEAAYPRFINVDGDSDLDLIVSHAFDVYYESTIRFFENDGANNFTERKELNNPFGGVDTYYYASPAFADMDGDSNLDLVLGGNVNGPKFFHNNGDNTFTQMYGVGNPFDFSTEYGIHPALVDLDNDLDLDLFIGGSLELNFYRNDGTSASPNFNPTPISNNLSTQVEMQFGLPWYGAAFVDDDGDLDFDAYVGGRYNPSNYLLFFKNDGTPLAPNFPSYSYVPKVNGPYYINNNNPPAPVDLDHDGDIDLVIQGGESNLLVYLRNSSSIMDELTGANNPFDDINSSPLLEGYRLVPEIVDFDKDGDLDVFVGTYEGHIVFLKNENQPIDLILGAGDLNFTENGAPVSGVLVGIDDPDVIDNSEIVQVEMKMIGYIPGEDQVVWVDQSNITGSFNVVGNELTLTLTGADSFINYANAVNSITYENLSEDPDVTPRVVEYKAWDSDFTNPNVYTKNIVITPVNDPPSIISSAGVTATEDVLYTYTGIADDLDDLNNGTELTWILSGQPAGMVVSTTGVVTWTPGEGVLTSGSVTLTVQDGGEDGALPDSQIFTISVTPVNDAPVITSSAGTSATVNVLYTYTPTVLDPDDSNNGTDLTWSLSGQPAGMTVSATGVVSWTPGTGVSTSGAVTLTVQDGGENGALPFSEVFTITVAGNNVAPTITSTAPATATEEVLYTYTPVVADPDDANNGTDLTWSLSGQPAGMAVSATGVVTWTPGEGVLTSGSVTLIVQDGGENGSLPFSEVFSITVTPVNDPPVIAGTGTALNHNSGISIIDNSVTASDVDNTTFASAQVAITSGFKPSTDLLAFTPQGSITGSYNSLTGVLDLSGSGTIAEYNAVLQSVTYENTLGLDISTRTVQFFVNDGSDNSNNFFRTINVDISDLPPSLALTSSTFSYTENAGSVSIDPGISITDDSPSITGGVIAITTNFTPGVDILGFTDQSGITGTFDPLTGILTLSGNASAAQYEAAIASLTYENTSDDPGALTKSVDIQLDDGTNTSPAVTLDIQITPVNDAPQLAGASTALSYRSLTGSVVVDNLITVTDPDNADIDGAVISVATNYSSGEDILGFTNQNGITGSFNTVTGALSLSGTASKANYQTALRSITYRNTAPVPSASTKSISFVISDISTSSNALTRSIQVASNQVVAASITTQVDLGTNATIDVIGQATFTAGDLITTTITGAPTRGTAIVNPDGSILYTPNNNSADGNTDQITYELCNQFVSCGTNTINVTINNSAPVINIAATLIQPGGRATVSLLSGISDQNGNIDPASVRIIDGPTSGLPATIDTDLNLIIDYSGSGFTGADHILIEACDFSGACTQFDVVIVVGDVNEVTVYQGVTPNNDGINDVLRILDVEFFPNNEIFIYNKIGKLVYNVTGYDNFGVVFAGFDDQGNELPDGTYFYVIVLEPGNRQSGFVVLQR